MLQYALQLLQFCATDKRQEVFVVVYYTISTTKSIVLLLFTYYLAHKHFLGQGTLFLLNNLSGTNVGLGIV